MLSEREGRGVLDGDKEGVEVWEGAIGLREWGPDIVAPPPLAEATEAEAVEDSKKDTEACAEGERSLDAEPPLGEGAPDGVPLADAEVVAPLLWLARALLLTLPVVVCDGEGLTENGWEALLAADGDAGALWEPLPVAGCDAPLEVLGRDENLLRAELDASAEAESE